MQRSGDDDGKYEKKQQQAAEEDFFGKGQREQGVSAMRTWQQCGGGGGRVEEVWRNKLGLAFSPGRESPAPSLELGFRVSPRSDKMSCQRAAVPVTRTLNTRGCGGRMRVPGPPRPTLSPFYSRTDDIICFCSLILSLRAPAKLSFGW